LKGCRFKSFLFVLVSPTVSYGSNPLVDLRVVFFAMLKPSCWQSLSVEFVF